MYHDKYIKYKKKYYNLKQMSRVKGNLKQIYILRHGETNWNVEKKLQGCESDIELNDKGRQQATITGKYLNNYQQNDIKIDKIYCSPQKRAIETGKIVIAELGFNSEMHILEELHEICQGELNGTTLVDRQSNHRFDKMNELQHNYTNIKDPIERMKKLISNEEEISRLYKRESLEAVESRIIKVLERIANDNCNKILIVTHSGFINNLFMYLSNSFDYKDGDVTNGQNCKLGYIEYYDSKFKIITYPNTLHFGLIKN